MNENSVRTETKPRKFDSLQQEAFLNLWRTYDRLKALEDKVFGEAQISAQQYNTLRLLKSAYPGSMPTLHLGARLISRAPDMTRLLDRLESRGYISRERRSDNRRVVEVSITQAGLDQLNELSESVRQCHEDQLGHMSDASLTNLINLLRESRIPHEDEGSLSLVDR